MVFLFLAFCPGIRQAYGASIASVDLAGASADVIIEITGSGLDPVASNNRVVFTHEGVSAERAAVTTADADAEKGLRRIGVPVPEGLPAGTAEIKVINTVTGSAIGGASIEIIGITIENPSASPGSSSEVRITGTPNARFVAGSTVAAFGDGIKVIGETVESPTSIVANITVAPDAAMGVRSIGLMTESQVAVLLRAFTVKEGPAPTAESDGLEGLLGPDMAASIDEMFEGLDNVSNVTPAVASNETAAPGPSGEVKADAKTDIDDFHDAKQVEISKEIPVKGNVAAPASEAKATAPGPLAPPATPKYPENKDKSIEGNAPLASAVPVKATAPDPAPIAPIASNDRPVKAEETGPEDVQPGQPAVSLAAPAKETGLKPSANSLSGMAGQTAEVTVKDLPAPGTISTADASAEESGLLRKVLVAFLGPFVLIGYLLSSIWK